MSEHHTFESPAPNLPNSTLAIISLVTGILGWTFFPFLGSLAAIITGHMAKKEIKENAGTLSGDGLATAGLVLGYSSIAITLCACLIIIAVIAMGFISIPFLAGSGYY